MCDKAAQTMAINDLAAAAQNAVGKLGRVAGPASKPSWSSRSTECVGLPTRIPSTLDFKCAMTPNTAWFHQCAKTYSMLLERLILDRQARALMGQRAVLYASGKTWWDAMDAPVRGYEHVILQSGSSNLSDDELEAWRTRQRIHAPLTGPRIKLAVILYVVLFACLVSLRFVSP